MRREDDDVSRHDPHFFVNIGSHPGQGRHRLALAAGRDLHYLLRRKVLQLVQLDQSVARIIDISEFNSRTDDIDHRAPFEAYFPAVFVRRVDDLLHAVNIGSKCGDDQPLFPVFGKNPVKCSSDCFFRHGKTGAFRICAVAQKCQNPLLADFSEALQVDRIPVDRRIIHLEITGMHDDPGRRIDRDRSSILNAVICLDKFYPEFPKVDRLPESYDFALHGLKQIVLLQLLLDQGHR